MPTNWSRPSPGRSARRGPPTCGAKRHAEALLGEEASTDIFLKDPAKAAVARTIVRTLASALSSWPRLRSSPGAFQQPLQPVHGRELPRAEMRARLNAIVAQSATTTERQETLEELWFMSLILPSREWFTPAMATVIDAQLRRGLVQSDPTDPNLAALDDSLFQKAVVWDLVRTEDLTRFGVSREGVREAISRLPHEERCRADGRSQTVIRLDCPSRVASALWPVAVPRADELPGPARPDRNGRQPARVLQVGPAHPVNVPLPEYCPPTEGLFVFRSIEAWLLRREFEKKIAGGKGGAGDAGHRERPDRRPMGAPLRVSREGPALLEPQQLDLKEQRRVRRNDPAGPCAPRSPGQGGSRAAACHRPSSWPRPRPIP